VPERAHKLMDQRMDYQAKLGLMMCCVHCSEKWYVYQGVFNNDDDFICDICYEQGCY
jgi:hypothetical protein